MTCEGVVHGYIDTPGIRYVAEWKAPCGTRYDLYCQLVISYGTYPGYSGVWPVYRERPSVGLTAEEVGQELGGN